MRSLRLLAVGGGIIGCAGLSSPIAAQLAPIAPAGETVGGISCDAQEGQRIHIHQHLVILDHGKAVSIPNNVGRPALLPCLYWLHTHTPDGIIHIEAPKERSFTLGDFFAVWGQPITATKVATATATKAQPLKV